MATTEELTEAFVTMMQHVSPAPPLTLMNHGPEEAAIVIAAIVDRCADLKLGLKRVWIGTELAEELGLADGSALKHGERPQIRVDAELERQLRFELAQSSSA